ncbi:MAG TPA: VOC family protein [Candidatus Elarobacter sp.]|nr:VOC family protein [Candidatus Elarobacter sp.]
MSAFGGIDHVDLRVPALGVVEAFYDAFMHRLGLTSKTYANVEFGGSSWHDGTPERYNAVEYHEENVSGRPALFFGVIEEASAQPARGRIAFAVAKESLDEWARALPEIGAREIEREQDDAYPAIFFTDPLGTRLEVCARRSRP